MISAEQLLLDLKELGVCSGDVLLVHSSFKSIGHMEQGADTIIAALRQALGDDGTLCMPALSYNFVDAKQPVFHLQETASCVGYLCEYFRQLPGVVRSKHPTHSVCAIGAQAEALCSEHHLDPTPGGAHSPFVKMRDCGGKILMLGCGLGPNTTMHAIEELVGAPYLFSGDEIEYQLEDNNAETITYIGKRHAVFDQHYQKIAKHLGDPDLRWCNIGEASSFLIDCRALWQEASKLMEEDAYYFNKLP